MKVTRPPIPKKPMKCRICGDDVMFPYALYQGEGGDDYICSRKCDGAYQVLESLSEKGRKSA